MFCSLTNQSLFINTLFFNS